MGRKRIYSNAAERAKAFRERRAGAELTPPPTRPKKPPSRPKRLEAAEDEVRDLLEHCQNWRENLPESLAGSALAEKLDEAISGLETAAESLAGIDLPLGFGRD